MPLSTEYASWNRPPQFEQLPMIMIAALLPEATSVLFEKLEHGHPLRAFPAVELGHDESKRPTVLRQERPSLPAPGEKDVILEQPLTWHIRRVAVKAVEPDVP